MAPSAPKRILESKAIPVEKIYANPLNPRRDYHLNVENKELQEMALSLQEAGQHNPATVYELLPDRPDEFMLVRGHRRHAGSVLAGLSTLDCSIVARPSSYREELEWLGSEDSLREDWGDFTRLQYARDLAGEYGDNISNTQMVARTGLPKAKLEVAEAMFSLEPEMVEHVAKWEEWYYLNKYKDKKESPPTSPYKLKIASFTPERAALIYKIFSAARANLPSQRTVLESNDLELQVRIAYNSRFDKIRDLERTLSAVEAVSRSSRPGDCVAIDKLFRAGESSGKEAHSIVDNVKNRHEQLLAKSIAHGANAVQEIARVILHADQLGNDLDLLREAQVVYARLEAQLNKAGNIIDRRINEIRNR